MVTTGVQYRYGNKSKHSGACCFVYPAAHWKGIVELLYIRSFVFGFMSSSRTINIIYSIGYSYFIKVRNGFNYNMFLGYSVLL